jgi:TRAP transporter TAXI family solute receptor
MRKSRHFVVTLTVVLVAGLFLLGVSIESLAASKEGTVKIAGGRVEDPWYAFSQALGNFINKNSEWLKAEVVSTAGLTANLELVQDKPTEYIALAPTSTTLHARPGHEWGEARKVYTGATFITNICTMTQLLMTYDEDLKTPQDFAGKTIDVGRKGAGNTPDHNAILEAWGILDKVKLIYSGFGGGVTKLMDGFCDATFCYVDHTYPAKFRKGALVDKLETKSPVYYVGFDRDMLLKLRKSEHGTVPVRIPGGALDPKTQPNDVWAFNDAVYLMADTQMDPKIVYEVTRVVYETPAEEWAKWHPQGSHMTPEVKVATPVPDTVPAHSGTKKYYEEKGIHMTDLADLLQ